MSLSRRRKEWADALPNEADPREPAGGDGGASRLMDPHMFMQLSEQMRDLARECGAADGQQQYRHLLTGYAQWLESCAHQMMPEAQFDFAWCKQEGRGGHWNALLGQRGHFSGVFIVQVLIMCFFSRGTTASMGSDAVGYVVRKVTKTFAPEAQHYLEQLLRGFRYPSPATVSRCRLYLDVAFMRYMADKHSEMCDGDVVLFGLADSSPQGGRNWLISEYMGVRGEHLQHVSEAITNLQMCARGPRQAGQAEAMKRWQQDIAEAMCHHCFPPAALGARHATLAHKAHAYMHQKRLESKSWHYVQKLNECHFAVCSDAGVEAGLNRIEASVCDLFPYWMDPLPIQAPGVAIEYN